jgi:probable phosphoglycerate mutase
VQLIAIRHALPLRSEPGHGADPALSEIGVEQAARLPEALDRFRIARVVSSPQRRAVQTAEPVAAARGLPIEIDERLAEYDRGMAEYLPVEQLRTERPEAWARMVAGQLPAGVDEQAFRERIRAAVGELVAATDPADTVAIFSHGGVINVLLHELLGTRALLAFTIDYASLTRVLYSRRGTVRVAAVNSADHVWDLLPSRVRD